MKVLMVNKFLRRQGGSETYMFRIGQRLEDLGHQVQYFGMDDPQNIVSNQLGLYTSNMDFHGNGFKKLLYPFSILYSREARNKLQRLIDAFHPDIVHLNNINFQLTPSVIDAAHTKGVPMVQTVHDTQVLCPSHLMLNLNDGTLCEKCVNHSKIHCVKNRCIHGSLAKSILGAAEGTLYQHLSTYQKVHTYICPSRFMQGMLNRDSRFQGKTRVLQNFIELCPPPQVEKQDYVLYFGGLSYEKGIPRLLDACRLLPQIPFVFCGKGPLEEMVRSANLPNLRYLGFQSGDALKQLIAQAAFCITFPVWYENCPMAVLEAQSLGTPVLASRIGGIPELIETSQDGMTGQLIDDGASAEAIAAAIAELHGDPERLAAMSRNCFARRDRLVSLERYVDQLLALYQEAIDEGVKA